MKKMRLPQIMIMSLMVLLPSSSFFLSSYLTLLITQNNHSQAQLSYAVKHKNIAALTFNLSKESVGSHHWLILMSELGKVQEKKAYELAIWYLTESENILDSEEKVATQKLAYLWFAQTIRFGSSSVEQKAKLKLAQQYFIDNDFESTKRLLTGLDVNFVKEDIEVLLLQLKLAIAQGQLDFVKEKLKESKQRLIETPEGRTLIADIQRYNVLFSTANNIENSSIPSINGETCLSSLQMFATNLEQLQHLDKLQSHFVDKPLAQFVCIARPRYLPKALLQCNANNKEAIQCDESIFDEIAKTVNTRHIGIMLKEGGANVHLGVMYIDSQDNVDIFSHEISHLLGFVDEYPLAKTHDKCQQPQLKPFAHNIAVLKSTYHGDRNEIRQNILNEIPWANNISEQTPILQKVGNKEQTWRLGTPEKFKDQIGLYLAESCENSLRSKTLNFNAYKPVHKQTQLRYFSNDFPTEYLKQLSSHPQHFLMPSFHYNIALAFYKKGRLPAANEWLNQATLWEVDAKRKEIISKGAF